MFSILDGDWLEERPGCPGLRREAPTARLCPPLSPPLPPTASSGFCSSSHDRGRGTGSRPRPSVSFGKQQEEGQWPRLVGEGVQGCLPQLLQMP